METAAKWFADQVHAHPTASAVLLIVWLSAVLLTNGLRFAYPTYQEMPRSVRFVIGFCDPLALNFWNLARKLDPEFKGEYKTNGVPNGKS